MGTHKFMGKMYMRISPHVCIVYYVSLKSDVVEMRQNREERKKPTTIDINDTFQPPHTFF